MNKQRLKRAVMASVVLVGILTISHVTAMSNESDRIKSTETVKMEEQPSEKKQPVKTAEKQPEPKPTPPKVDPNGCDAKGMWWRADNNECIPKPAATSVPAPGKFTPAPTQKKQPANFASGSTVWDRLAQCESGGNWAINTGNSFYGGLQFTKSTWLGYGGGAYAPRADLASREQQTEIAIKTQAGQGWGAWPACTSKLGIR